MQIFNTLTRQKEEFVPQPQRNPETACNGSIQAARSSLI